MVITSLARSLPGQNLLPAPKRMKASALAFKFCLQENKNSVISIYIYIYI